MKTYLHQIIHITDKIVMHLQFSVDRIEYIFNSTVTRPIGGAEDNTMASIINQLKNGVVFMDVQIVHRKAKGASGTIHSQPINEISHEAEEAIKIGPTLRELLMELKWILSIP